MDQSVAGVHIICQKKLTSLMRIVIIRWIILIICRFLRIPRSVWLLFCQLLVAENINRRQNILWGEFCPFQNAVRYPGGLREGYRNISSVNFWTFPLDFDPTHQPLGLLMDKIDKTYKYEYREAQKLEKLNGKNGHNKLNGLTRPHPPLNGKVH